MEIKDNSNQKLKGKKISISHKNVISQNMQKDLIESHFNNDRENARKYTIEHTILVKDFVPVIRPIKINIVPTKLILNEEKKYKRNKNSLLSCFTSQSSDDGNEIDNKLELSNSSEISDISDLSNKDVSEPAESNMKKIRKNLIILRKHSIHKANSKKNLKNKKLRKYFHFNEEKKNNRIIEEDSFSSDLYEEDYNYLINPYKNNYIRYMQNKSSKIVINSLKNFKNIINENINQDEKYEKRNRIYSFSILETLKNRLKIK